MKKFLVIIPLLLFNFLFAQDFFYAVSSTVLYRISNEQHKRCTVTEKIPLFPAEHGWIINAHIEGQNIFFTVRDTGFDFCTFMRFDMQSHLLKEVYTLGYEEARIDAVYFQDGNWYTLECGKKQAQNCIVKRSGQNKAVLSSVFVPCLDVYTEQGYKVVQFEIDTDNGVAFFSLETGSDFYGKKDYVLAASLKNGEAVFFAEARYLSFSASEQKMYFSRENALYVFSFDGADKPGKVSEIKTPARKNERILFFKKADDVYVCGFQKRKKNTVMHLLFGYGFNTADEYLICSETEGTLQKEQTLIKIKNALPLFDIKRVTAP